MITPSKPSAQEEEVIRRQQISAANAPLDPNLKTFTVFGWMSTSRNITNPYDLVFRLRPTNDQYPKKEAESVWNTIAESTLKGDDLAKFKNHLGGGQMCHDRVSRCGRSLPPYLPPDAGEDVA